MAIKKRPPVDPAREAQIEAFGTAADTTPTLKELQPKTVEPVTVHDAPTTRRPIEAGGKKPKPKSKPMLVRFDEYEHQLLYEIAQQEGRSMHNMAKTLLIPALEAMKNVPK